MKLTRKQSIIDTSAIFCLDRHRNKKEIIDRFSKKLAQQHNGANLFVADLVWVLFMRRAPISGTYSPQFGPIAMLTKYR